MTDAMVICLMDQYMFIHLVLVVSHVTLEAIIKFVRIVTIMETYFRVFISILTLIGKGEVMGI